MSPLRWLDLKISGFAKTRPRLQRLLCRVGIHARMVKRVGVTFDGALVSECTCCGARFERPGF